MKLAFLIVALVLLLLDALLYWTPSTPWGGRLQSLALAFFVASFLPLP